MQTATRTRNAESSRRSRPGFFPEAQAAAPDALVTTLALNVWAPAVTASTALAAALGGRTSSCCGTSEDMNLFRGWVTRTRGSCIVSIDFCTPLFFLSFFFRVYLTPMIETHRFREYIPVL